MDMDASNIRPIAILASYLTLAAALTISIIKSIVARHAQSIESNTKQDQGRLEKKNIISLFSTLAIGSLGVTWFYMFSFFAQSYSDWAFVQAARRFEGISGVGSIDFGSWLRDSKLFQEAWGIAMASKARWWWTQQIFSWTTLWSFWVGIEGYRYKIPSLYKFMLLGQIVAISFATNLFFLEILVSPRTSTSTSPRKCGFDDAKNDLKDEVPKKIFEQDTNISKSSKNNSPREQEGDRLISFLCLQFLIFPGLGSAAVLPNLLNTPSFMPILLAPHVLLFVPPLLAYFAPDFSYCQGVIDSIGREQEKLYTTIVVASIALFGWIILLLALLGGM
ncbi:hypothetical protein E2P81_ATG12065 [Venturia nashicola]|nr:hypothetical protein E2P81_ATG12065 [Venturia nashicola]